MAALSVRTSLGLCVWILVLLVLIFIQMLTSLVIFGGEFISSNETLISPFRCCLRDQHGKLFCDRWHRFPVCGAGSETKTNIATEVVISLYVPLVLVAFALLSTLLAAYVKDKAVLWCSAACQAASSLFTLIGVVAFLLLNHPYVSWEHMTFWFYICLGTGVQLLMVAALTVHAGTRRMSDWEPIQCNENSSSPC